MDPRVATILKMAAFGLVALILGGFIMKHVKLSKKTERLASEMRTLASDTGFYHSPTVEAAQGTLFKGVALIRDAKALGLEPSAYFDIVFHHDEKKDKVGLDDDEFDQPAREKLVRDTMMRAYQQAEAFGFFDTPEQLGELKEGKMPEVKPKAVVACIIDPALSPGMEKIVPNLELRTVFKTAGPPTDLEVAAAKNLSADLYSARVIDSNADNRIRKHYEKRGELPAPAVPQPAPAPTAPPVKAEPQEAPPVKAEP